MYYVYLLKSVGYKKSYVGTTDNLERRLSEHNAGKTPSTNKLKPWKLVYQEQHGTYRQARERESYLKSGAGRRFLQKIFEK